MNRNDMNTISSKITRIGFKVIMFMARLIYILFYFLIRLVLLFYFTNFNFFSP